MKGNNFVTAILLGIIGGTIALKGNGEPWSNTLLYLFYPGVWLGGISKDLIIGSESNPTNWFCKNSQTELPDSMVGLV